MNPAMSMVVGSEHRRTRVYMLRYERNEEAVQRTISAPNGFVERFNGTILEEFYRATKRATCSDCVDTLQADLGTRLAHYNTDRPQPGFRSQGRSGADATKTPGDRWSWQTRLKRHLSPSVIPIEPRSLPPAPLERPPIILHRSLRLGRSCGIGKA